MSVTNSLEKAECVMRTYTVCAGCCDAILYCIMYNIMHENDKKQKYNEKGVYIIIAFLCFFYRHIDILQ